MNSKQPLLDNPKPVAIKSITVMLKKRELVLSLEEAQELQRELNNVLGHTVCVPYIAPQIVYVDRYVPPFNYPWLKPQIICGGVSGYTPNLGISTVQNFGVGLGNQMSQLT